MDEDLDMTQTIIVQLGKPQSHASYRGPIGIGEGSLANAIDRQE